MRRWPIYLFIALLPLRLWATATMPGQIPNAHAAPTQQTTPCHAVLADAAAAPSNNTAHEPAPAHSLCVACDACHSPLGLMALPTAALANATQSAPLAHTLPVQSADAQPHHKPPIG